MNKNSLDDGALIVIGVVLVIMLSIFVSAASAPKHGRLSSGNLILSSPLSGGQQAIGGLPQVGN